MAPGDFGRIEADDLRRGGRSASPARRRLHGDQMSIVAIHAAYSSLPKLVVACALSGISSGTDFSFLFMRAYRTQQSPALIISRPAGVDSAPAHDLHAVERLSRAVCDLSAIGRRFERAWNSGATLTKCKHSITRLRLRVFIAQAGIGFRKNDQTLRASPVLRAVRAVQHREYANKLGVDLGSDADWSPTRPRAVDPAEPRFIGNMIRKRRPRLAADRLDILAASGKPVVEMVLSRDFVWAETDRSSSLRQPCLRRRLSMVLLPVSCPMAFRGRLIS